VFKVFISNNSARFCFGPSSDFKLNLSINLLKFSSLNFEKTSSLFHSFILNSSRFSSIGTSKFIVPSVLESIANSLFSNNLSFAFGFKSSSPFSIASYIPSIVLYFFTSSNAVFSPIPGTPGILSEVSPCKPFTSISCFGVTPYFFNTSSLPKVSVSVFPIFVCGIRTLTLFEVS